MSTGDYISFFFEPESVAVVGASPVMGKPSRIILDNLRRIGFEGAIYPTNPRYTSIDGLRCYPSMTDVEEPIDLAVIVLPAFESSDKFKGAIVVSGGFKEIGDDGKRLEEDLRDLVRNNGFRDPRFGPVIVFGLGGFMVELIRDITFRLAPLDEKEALVMMSEVKSYPLLRGYRGIEPVNLKKLSSVIVIFSDILMEMEMIEEIEINPLMVKGDKIKAADVRVLLRE